MAPRPGGDRREVSEQRIHPRHVPTTAVAWSASRRIGSEMARANPNPSSEATTTLPNRTSVEDGTPGRNLRKL